MYDIEVQSENDPRLYPAGETRGYARIRVPETWVHAAPDAASARLSQYTYGEPLRILDAAGLTRQPPSRTTANRTGRTPPSPLPPSPPRPTSKAPG